MTAKNNINTNTNDSFETSLPLHTSHINDGIGVEADSSSSDPQAGIKEATNRFYEQVIKGISVLEQRHGYSREKASALILGEIRRGDSPPSDDEVFRVMEKLGIGMDDASKTATVAKALKKTRIELGLSPADAIDHLSSYLTVMNLLSKVESNSDRQHDHPYHDNSHEPEIVLQEKKKHNLSEENGKVVPLSHLNSNIRTNSSRKTHGSKNSAPKHVKSRSSARGVTMKAPRKRSTTDENSSNVVNTQRLMTVGNDVDVKVAEKVIMAKEQKNHNSESVVQRNKSPSPAVVRTKRGIDDLEPQGQQPLLKRSRTDSV